MRKTYLAVAAATALFFSLLPSAQGQELKTGYFLDYNIYGSSLNPALQPERTDFFMGVAVGDVNLRASSNVGVSSFFFPYNGELVTGLNKNIPASTFLGGLQTISKVNADLSENIFGIGVRSRSGEGFTTVKLNLKSSNSLGAPKSLFEFLKVGGSDNVYTIDNVTLSSRNYLELSVGYSRQIGDMVTVGAALKGLMGLADVRMDVDRISLDTRGDVSIAEAEGTLKAAVPYVSFPSDENGHIDFSEPNSISKFSLKPAGFGLAADLGVTVTPLDGLTVSAALTDLGFISWKQSMSGSMGRTTFDLSENLDVEDNLADLFRFKNETASGSYASMLNAQANLGVKYRLPFTDMLSVGALYSTRIGNPVSRYHDFRAGVTFTPGRMFSIAGSAGVSSCGFSGGAAMNLWLGGLNVFAGFDGIFSQVTAQYLPVNPVSSVAKIGISLVFGTKSRD